MAADVLNLQEDTELSPNVNYTDPIVRHDPTKQKTPIVKLNNGDRVINTDNGSNNFPVDPKMVEGCQVPIIRLESQNVISVNISYCKIDYTGFKPKLILDVLTEPLMDNNDMAMSNIGGMNSTITVVLTPRVDGQYKPISLDFTVDNIQYTDDMTHFEAVYKLPEMDRVQTKQWKHSGCNGKYCQTPEAKHPTTWKLLHDISGSLGLGYATTDHVKEIKDYKARLTHNETLENTIKKHTAFGGLGEDSIFDSWIDLYNYLVVVNVPWVLNEDITWKDVGVNAIIDSGSTDTSIPSAEHIGMCTRILTNDKKYTASTNMIFTNFRWEVNNEDQKNAGTTLNCFVGNPSGYGEGNNSVSANKYVNPECSFDGMHIDEYDVQRQEYLGNECSSEEDNNTPILLQKQIHDRYLSNLRGKILVVTLENTNFGLQRGTLVGVMFFDSSQLGKMEIAQNWDNLDGGKKDVHPRQLDAEVARRIENQTTAFPNFSISGWYYIDGMEFEYEGTSMILTQRLYLIKAGPYSNFQTKNDTYARSYSENI